MMVLRRPALTGPAATDDAMSTPWWVWALFNAAVLGVLAVDLGVARRRHRAQTAAEAARWVMLWVSLSLAFGVVLWAVRGPERGLEFFTAYVIEYALSVDNLFVFLLVFQYFRVAPASSISVVLGVLGAFLLRGSLILGGAALVHEFQWLLYLFGAFSCGRPSSSSAAERGSRRPTRPTTRC
jgi:tellurite resistance protein TerC